MKYLKHTLFALGFLWVGIVNLLFYLFWFARHKRKGTFEKVEWDWNCWAWKCDINNNSEFYNKYMRRWWGFVIGSFIVFVNKSDDLSHMKHEEAHILQNYIFGPLFYPMFYLMSLCIYIFGSKNIHSYYHNPFELWARYSANQPISKPKEIWDEGPTKRWYW